MTHSMGTGKPSVEVYHAPSKTLGEVLLEPEDPQSIIQECITGFGLDGPPSRYRLGYLNSAGHLVQLFPKSLVNLEPGHRYEFIDREALAGSPERSTQVKPEEASPRDSAYAASCSAPVPGHDSSAQEVPVRGATADSDHVQLTQVTLPTDIQQDPVKAESPPETTPVDNRATSEELLPPHNCSGSMFASQSQGTPRAAYPRNRLDDLSDSSAHEDNDDEEEDQPQERAFSIPMSEIDPTLVEDFDNNQVQRAADSEHNEDVVQPAASISGTQQEEQQRPLRPGLYNRSQKKMPSTEAMFAELRSKPSAKSPTEDLLPRAQNSAGGLSTPGEPFCVVDIETRPKRPRRSYLQGSPRDDKTQGKKKLATHDDAVTFVSGSNEGDLLSPGRVTRAQRGNRGLDLQTKLEERQQQRKKDETMVHWGDEIYAFNSQTVGEIKDEVTSDHSKTKSLPIPGRGDLHVLNWATPLEDDVQISSLGDSARLALVYRTDAPSQHVGFVKRLTVDISEAITAHRVPFLSVFVDFRIRNTAKRHNTDGVMSIWDRIRDTHPHLSPSRHLLMGEVEDESGALVSVDLYAHKKLRKYTKRKVFERALKVAPMPKRSVILNYRVKTQTYNKTFENLPATISVADLLEHHLKPIFMISPKDMRIEHYNGKEFAWEDLAKLDEMLFANVQDGATICMKNKFHHLPSGPDGAPAGSSRMSSRSQPLSCTPHSTPSTNQ